MFFPTGEGLPLFEWSGNVAMEAIDRARAIVGRDEQGEFDAWAEGFTSALALVAYQIDTQQKMPLDKATACIVACFSEKGPTR